MPDLPVPEGTPECEKTDAADLVRSSEAERESGHDAWLARHAASCPSCSRVAQGARRLGRELAAWAPVEAPDELAERTLARVRLAGALDDPAALGAAPSALAPAEDAAHRERKPASRSVDILAAWALPGPRPALAAPPRARLRFLTAQAAAAVLIFLLTSGFAITFYPVFVEALEESRVQACQARLGKVTVALRAYRKDHPDADVSELKGTALRDALVHGGYLVPQDLLCPAVHGARPGMVCFELRVPDADCDPQCVLAWDRFGNHSGGFDIAYADGHTEYVETRDFSTWLARVRSTR
ncbi:hypothetical protein HY251_20845 [bacterium]|nr:hypothetical protein [bacterium]